jgi:lysophospholipase L1-like esterase
MRALNNMSLKNLGWLLVVGSLCLQARSDQGDLSWPEVSVENRPGAYWWWMGSAVDKPNITWNLEAMRKAGMGGGTIVPIYGVKGREDQYIQHLSPTFVDMVSHAAKEAKRLGMWVDMTTGTGWPFGGPMITDETCDARVVYKDGKVSQKFSGRNVKRAAPGNAGKGINPFSAKAMNFYLQHFDEPFARDGIVMPRAMYHDSYEFMGNWTKALPEEFAKRRGYDLTEHYPALFDKGDPDTVARIKADYRETLSDLHLDYLKAWVKWSESKGCGTRNQAHGSPSNLLDLYAASSIPETETFGSTPFKIPGIRRESNNIRGDTPQPLINRMASSAAHVTGKPLVASETCTWVRNHFRSALSQVKPEVDQLFLNGINHIFFHGTCYSPKDAAWPGWLFYASLQYNPRNAIWRDAPLLNAYITRCQSILQSGKHDNDVAVYWPVHDIWHNPKGLQQMLTVHHPQWLTDSACGSVAEQLKKEGVGYDFISDRQLLADLGKPYKAIVVPQTAHMPLDTLKKLLELSGSGQPVIFLDRLPADVPGFNKLEERRAELKQILQGQGHQVVASSALIKALDKTAVVREAMVDHGLDFIRRRHNAGYHYFVANMSAKPVNNWVALGVPFRSVAIMDPRSADSGVATAKDGRIYLQLKPGETRILRTFDQESIAGMAWRLLEKSGDPITVEGEWSIAFVDGGPKLPADIRTAQLSSWTDIGDEEAERFAGTARYSIEVNIPDGADDWEIDLGDVRESARVFINGKEAAGLFSVPFSAPVGRYLKPGSNLLEIEVTNLSANRIRDLDIRKVNWQKFHEINFVNLHYKRFDASKWPLTPSGLLGPVVLTPLKVKTQLSSAKKTTTIGLIGDSTVATTYGWGPAFAERCDERVKVLNYAKNGATLDSLSGKLGELLKQKPDYVLIQFGHNDMKRYDSAAYAKKLTSYVDRIRKAGGKPVILSSVTRRNFDENGKIKPRWWEGDSQRSLPVFAKAAQRVAEEQNLPFIDLYAISLAHHNRIGPKASAAYDFKEDDQTHFSKEGAAAIANLVVAELKRVVPGIEVEE